MSGRLRVDTKCRTAINRWRERKAYKMTVPARYFLDLILRLFGRSCGTQECILHDPEAQNPKDLDNPFHEVTSQGRVGDLIGRSRPVLGEKTEK